MRPSVDETMIQVARVIADRATCSRLHVGAVLTRDTRIVAHGYNGAPAGMPHCSHDGSEDRCLVSTHAERNVVGFAARHGVRTDGTTLYLTHAPCLDCATVLLAAGVVRVVYGETYRSLDGVDYLQGCGIDVSQYREVARRSAGPHD